MVLTKERGWAGHFCNARSCGFRRNTLVSGEGINIVVSTVGASRNLDGKIQEIGCDRYYETMAFHSQESDAKYHDANVSRQIDLNGEWSAGEEGLSNENLIDDMHDAAVQEIVERICNGEFKPQ